MERPEAFSSIQHLIPLKVSMSKHLPLRCRVSLGYTGISRYLPVYSHHQHPPKDIHRRRRGRTFSLQHTIRGMISNVTQNLSPIKSVHRSTNALESLANRIYRRCLLMFSSLDPTPYELTRHQRAFVRAKFSLVKFIAKTRTL